MLSSVISSHTRVNYGSIRAYQFPALVGTRHAVFTRLGGSSPVPWQSLNLGSTVGDTRDNVTRNFTLACGALDIDPEQTASCHLVHGNRVVTAAVGQANGPLEKADGLITNQPGLFLTLRFADCVPLLIYDPFAKAIGLAHAGWRGTAQNVMGSVLEAMQIHFGSQLTDIKVVIGPSIGPCCYEVQQDVLGAIGDTFEEPSAFFVKKNGKLIFDMWRANAYQAYRAGVSQVVISALCTACCRDEFFSHRAEKGRTGRFGVFLGLPDNGAE